ncbi:hypothetical protein B0H17DRAFT_1258637 [Mycena rosella]|uniref:MYND-type domain-containing protein n=1 Tax=Mycena rosella TaxID=1033263 RepID=A0AAD7CSM0_MYCRO|nr:hypothetical protein B0H17DRAFT_1258637 [Mycena rosella]
MPFDIAAPKPAWDDRAGPILTIWDQWQPACDACGRLESSLKDQQLRSCAGCLLGKYCSFSQAECQKQDWSKGHKNRCHLFEADRKLSSVFAKSLGPGTLNDPTLSLVDKVVQWNFLNSQNHAMIACAALKNDNELAKGVNVGIFLKLVEGRTGSKYDHRSFIIDKVALLPREDTDDFANNAQWTKGHFRNHQEAMQTAGEHSKLLVGFCWLPGGVRSETQMWMMPVGSLLAEIRLPPGFDLHRYITHVNRGITHFHASFWPLPRKISDADLDAAEPPDEWIRYAQRLHMELSGLKGQGVIGIERPDGTRIPLYKYSQNGHFRRCAPGETDTDGPEEFKKLLVDPSRMVRMISELLEYFDVRQDTILAMSEVRCPSKSAPSKDQKLPAP